MAYSQISQGSNAQSGARASSFFDAIAERVRRYRTYRQTLAELEALSDRELADLGLHHSMIRACAYSAAYDV